MIGPDNIKVLLLYVVFFAAVFAIMFFLNKNAKKNEREGKAGTGAKPVMQIIGVMLFVAIASIVGLLRHGIVGYIVVFLALTAIFVVIYMLIKNRQRHFELTTTNPIVKIVISVVTGILAIGLPLMLVISNNLLEPGAMPIIITLVGILAFICLIALALILVNRKGDNVGIMAAGYAMVILAAILPGILTMFATKDSGAFAWTYMAALVAAVLAYFSLNQIYKID